MSYSKEKICMGLYYPDGIPENLRRAESLSRQIVKFAFENGKGLAIEDVKTALSYAEGHFPEMVAVTDGMFLKVEE